MSLHSWLQNLRSALAPRGGQRRQARRGSKRNPTHRPNLEVLEDRLTPSFSPATSFPVGPNPQAMEAADFNNDNHLDLAAANGDGTLSVLLGDGRGGFRAAIAAAGNANPDSLAVADFNNDGNRDLATASDYGNDGVVSVLLGNGDGTFRAPTSPAVAWPVMSVAAGDFNADGNSDLVVSEHDWDSFGYVQVLLGNGRGDFRQSGYLGYPGYQIGNPAPVLAVGDLNGDGALDAVAVVEGAYTGYALLGDGAGTFLGSYFNSQFYSDTAARGVAVGDLTGDRIPDLVVAGQLVEILPGLGGSSFGSSVPRSANGTMHTAVATADFNGDGTLDAVTADGDRGTVSELLGNGDGTLRYAGAYAVGPSPSAVAVGDFNEDGRPDVAAANAGSNTVSVLLNNGTWTPSPPPPPPPPSLKIGDATVTEGHTGTALAVFTVTLSAPSAQPVTVPYATANGTATPGSDYQARSGTLAIPAGRTTGTITVPIIGDRLPEPNEAFFVSLSSATNATIAGGQALGTIADDEPRISISDVSKVEGKRNKTTLFTFTVTLSAPYDQSVMMSFRTADGTASTGDGDYVAKSGTLTFAPGETTKTITIEVKGDSKKQADETFYLDLSGLSSNALFTKNRGLGTILNDD
jgi:hypothetical protein